jgi:hypothetical protein
MPCSLGLSHGVRLVLRCLGHNHGHKAPYGGQVAGWNHADQFALKRQLLDKSIVLTRNGHLGRWVTAACRRDHSQQEGGRYRGGAESLLIKEFMPPAWRLVVHAGLAACGRRPSVGAGAAGFRSG